MDIVLVYRVVVVVTIIIYSILFVLVVLTPQKGNRDKSRAQPSRPKGNSSFYVVSRDSLYVYSAYFDNRQTGTPSDGGESSAHSGGVVRVFGLYNSELLQTGATVQCRMYHQGRDGREIPVLAPGVLKNLEIGTTCVWNTVEILCVNMFHQIPPHQVSLLVPGAVDHRIPVTNIHREQEWRRHLRDIQDDDLAVCVSTVYGLRAGDSGSLIQAVDMKYSMGADKLFIYGSYDNAPEIQHLLESLSGPTVQLLDWVLPDVIVPNITHDAVNGVKNCTRYNAQPLQYLDCQYRSMYKYRYLATLDMDEFIFPMATSINTVDMLDGISARNNHQVASFLFFYYQSCYTVREGARGLRLRGWGHRGALYSSLWVPYTFKCVHRPELVTYARIHRYGRLLEGATSTIVSPTEATLYHFRFVCLPGQQPITTGWKDNVINLYLNRTDTHLELSYGRI